MTLDDQGCPICSEQGGGLHKNWFVLFDVTAVNGLCQATTKVRPL
ncbi:unnamed protein product [Anisakis simplex]|uniref:Uncharacterized protein n=1 Tax=Anisakis simplex TaxID=6269 RepID=A0A0M3KBJ0_ANISI|nr:unnamed protein product [Anisakis simplex]